MIATKLARAGIRVLPAFALAVALAASAHHSHSMFDTSREVSIVGTIKEFQFTNPHTWLYVVAESDGQLYSFESRPPSTLLRGGIKQSSFPVGEKVTVQAWPFKDGRHGGELVAVVRADGTVLKPPGGGVNAGVAADGNY